MPDPLVVSIFLSLAALALLWSPMPGWIRIIQSCSFFYLALIFLATEFGYTTSDQRSVLIRIGLIVLSSVSIISTASWRLAGCKVWRKL